MFDAFIVTVTPPREKLRCPRCGEARVERRGGVLRLIQVLPAVESLTLPVIVVLELSVTIPLVDVMARPLALVVAVPLCELVATPLTLAVVVVAAVVVYEDSEEEVELVSVVAVAVLSDSTVPVEPALLVVGVRALIDVVVTMPLDTPDAVETLVPEKAPSDS